MEEIPVRERILDAAAERFLSLGIVKVTMDEIAADCGVSKKTMYQFYRTKDELTEAVMLRHIERVRMRLGQIMESDCDVVTKLDGVWSTIGDVVSRFSKNLQNDIRRYYPSLWKTIEEQRRSTIMTTFGRLFDEAARAGIIRPDLDKELVLRIYVGAIEAVINPEVLIRSPFTAADAFRTIVRVMFNGILTPEGQTEFQNRISKTVTI